MAGWGRADTPTVTQAHLGDGVGPVPGHENKATTSGKQVVTFLLVEGLAFNL